MQFPAWSQLHYVCCLSTTPFCQSTSVLSFTCLSTCLVLCFAHVCPVLRLSVHLSNPLLCLFTSAQSFTCLFTCQVLCFLTSVLSFTCLSTCQVLCFAHICPVLRLSVHLSSPLLCSRLSSPSLVCPLVKSFALLTSVQSFACQSTCQIPLRSCIVCLVLHVCPFLHLCVHLPSPSRCSCPLLSPCFRKKSKKNPKQQRQP